MSAIVQAAQADLLDRLGRRFDRRGVPAAHHKLCAHGLCRALAIEGIGTDGHIFMRLLDIGQAGGDHAFGHIGFTNVVVWADPERELSAALMTSGKPLVYPEFVWLFEILRRIGAACPVTRPGGLAAMR